jgi:hypothetical protein
MAQSECTPIVLQDIQEQGKGHWGSSAGSNISSCWHRLSRLESKGWAWRTKGSYLIYPCKQVTEAKSKIYPIYGCMQLYWLFCLQCYMTFFTFRFFVLSSCYVIPSSLLHYQNTDLLASFLALLPATIMPSDCYWEVRSVEDRTKGFQHAKPLVS